MIMVPHQGPTLGLHFRVSHLRVPPQGPTLGPLLRVPPSILPQGPTLRCHRRVPPQGPHQASTPGSHSRVSPQDFILRSHLRVLPYGPGSHFSGMPFFLASKHLLLYPSTKNRCFVRADIFFSFLHNSALGLT